MALLTIHNAQLAFGDHPLLDKAEFALQENERVCLVGRNGAGKSTLMKVLAGDILLDDGKIQITQDVVVSRLEQDPPRNQEGTVYEYVSGGLAEIGEQLKIYHDLLDLVAQDPSEKNINRLAKIQEQLDHLNAWRFDDRVKNVLGALKLDPETKLTDLSGGQTFHQERRGDPGLLRSASSQPLQGGQREDHQQRLHVLLPLQGKAGGGDDRR